MRSHIYSSVPRRDNEGLRKYASDRHKKCFVNPTDLDSLILIVLADKGKFINKERLRWARLFDVPMQEGMPPGFPKNTLPVERVLSAVMLLHPEKMQETFAVLYHASFAEHRDVVEKDTLLSLLARVHGEDRAKEIMTKVN